MKRLLLGLCLAAPIELLAQQAAKPADELDARLRPSLRRVLNATGVVVHTNLGRAPLADAALERVRELGAGYSNLEFDLKAGSRGSRQDPVAAALRDLSGADAAPVAPSLPDVVVMLNSARLLRRGVSSS